MRPEKPSIDLRAEPGDVIVLTLIGDHDLATKPSLVAELAALAPEAAVVIDLTRCTFVDSTVIGAILNTRQPDRPRVSLVLPPDTSYVVRSAVRARRARPTAGAPHMSRPRSRHSSEDSRD